MKILFTCGGSGGHFYPIIAIAEELHAISRDERLIPPTLFFMAPDPYDPGLLFENSITFISLPTGKFRRYFSLKNITDIFRTAFATIKAAALIFRLYPDVVVGKGGFGSFPALFAARFWKIPIFIHESDAVPGWVNRWAGKFAARVAVSFEKALSAFPKGRVAHTGNPIRRDLLSVAASLRQELSLEEETQVILLLGGSLGSAALNETVLQALPEFLLTFEVIHQTGEEHLADMQARAEVILQNHPFKRRYHSIWYLSTTQMGRAGRIARLIISRAGSTIFEIAAWGKPSLLVPFPVSSGDHQRENAYAYAEHGAAVVLEENNLTASILIHEARKILEDSGRHEEMSKRASHFAKPDAASVIAREILNIALRHEK